MRTSVRLSRRIAITAAVVAAAGTAAAVGLAGFAHATTSAGRASSPACKTATLRGTYLFDVNGWSVSGGTDKPLAFAGTEYFDGAGHIRGSNAGSVNGAITPNVAYTGTYKVAADCTGTFTIGTARHLDLYTSPDGSAFTYVQTDRGTIDAGLEQRVAG